MSPKRAELVDDPVVESRAAAPSAAAECPVAAPIESLPGLGEFQAAIDLLAIELAVVDDRGCIVAMNHPLRESAESAGEAPGDATGMTLDVLAAHLAPDAAVGARIRSQVEAVLRGGQPGSAIDFVDRRHAPPRCYRVAASPLCGRARGAVVVRQDMSALAALDADRAAEERGVWDASLRADGEIERLQCYPERSAAGVRAAGDGLDPLSRRLPRDYAALADRYAAALRRLVLNRAYRMEEDTARPLQEIAERIGSLKGGPRDVIELHRMALDRLAPGARAVRTRVLVEEGRMQLITLLGYLAAHYRNRALGGRAAEERTRP